MSVESTIETIKPLIAKSGKLHSVMTHVSKVIFRD